MGGIGDLLGGGKEDKDAPLKKRTEPNTLGKAAEGTGAGKTFDKPPERLASRRKHRQ